jgi:predicted nuclease of predicted toxin-antitoxin system
MKILIDMNLSPDWVSVLGDKNIDAVHWSQIGSPKAPDHQIFSYAQSNDYVVFTHDLDFGDILAATGAVSPSVIQLRAEDTSPQALIDLFLSAIQTFKPQLKRGALITVQPEKLRARILPIGNIN